MLKHNLNVAVCWIRRSNHDKRHDFQWGSIWMALILSAPLYCADIEDGANDLSISKASSPENCGSLGV